MSVAAGVSKHKVQNIINSSDILQDNPNARRSILLIIARDFEDPFDPKTGACKFVQDKNQTLVDLGKLTPQCLIEISSIINRHRQRLQ